MKILPLLPILTLLFGPAVLRAADPAPPRKPLISTRLSGLEVDFVRGMTDSSLMLLRLAALAKDALPEGEMADYANSLTNAAKEERANLAILAREQGMTAPGDPPSAKTVPSRKPEGRKIEESEFLAEVIRIRSEQLKLIQKVGATQSESIRNFAAAMVKTIQDDLIFIQLVSSRAQKAASESEPAAKPAE